MRATASVTIGVNLNDRLQPVEATLLAINGQGFTANRCYAGCSAPRKTSGRASPRCTASRRQAQAAAHPGVPNDPMLVPLFRDLALVLEKAALPVAEALKRYAGLNGDFLAGLRHELPFYLGALHLIGRLREQGLPVCRPELAPADERVCLSGTAYNVDLA